MDNITLKNLQDLFFNLDCDVIQLSLYYTYILHSLPVFRILEEFIFILENFHIVDLLCSVACIIPISSESLSSYLVPSVCLLNFEWILYSDVDTTCQDYQVYFLTLFLTEQETFCIKSHNNKYFRFLYSLNIKNIYKYKQFYSIKGNLKALILSTNF